MIHKTEGAIELGIYRPTVGILSVVAVRKELRPYVKSKAVIVGKVVFEDDAETKTGKNIERMDRRQDGVKLVVGQIFCRIVFGLGEIIRDRTTEADIHLRVICRVVLAQRMPVDDVIDKSLRAAEEIRQEAEYRRQHRRSSGVAPRKTDLVGIRKIIAENRFVVKCIAIVSLMIGECRRVFAYEKGGAGLVAEKPAFAVLVGRKDGLGGEFHDSQQGKRQNK